MRAAARASAILAILAVPAIAQADPPPLRIGYRAADGCPRTDAFFDEIQWRTSAARIASPGERALEVEADVAKHGALFRGHLVIGEGESRITRRIESESCVEVIAALALVTALAVDPHASTARKRPAAIEPPPSSPPAVASAPSIEARPTALPPEIIGAPLPAWIATERAAPSHWTIGVRTAMAFSVTSHPLIGGGAFVERAFEGAARVSLRLAIEAASTGTFATGPSAASFLRGVGRLEVCAFAARAGRISLVPCLGAEGGVLRGQGVAAGAITQAEQDVVPWLGAGFLPRLGVAAGAVSIEAQGGPELALLRRSFVFRNPSHDVGSFAPVTWMAGIGAGFHFP